MHEPETTDDDVPVVVNPAHNEVMNLDTFTMRLDDAITRFSMAAYAQRPKEQTLIKWLDDLQEWLTLDELLEKEIT